MNFGYFTVAYGCVLIAALIPIFCAGLAKYGMFSQPREMGGYDNHQPRAWLARQTDWRARANAAQANTFEALPFFFAAVIIAHQLHARQAPLDMLALLFIVLRVAYVLMYVADMARTRSAVWAAAWIVNAAILLLGYR
jgi:uncharacterized MAPEG superfamily protein